jgi:hypothetical protein
LDDGFNGIELNPMGEWIHLGDIFYTSTSKIDPQAITTLYNSIYAANSLGLWVHLKLFGDVESRTHPHAVGMDTSLIINQLSAFRECKYLSISYGWDAYEYLSEAQAEAEIAKIKAVLPDKYIGIRPNPKSFKPLAKNTTYSSAEQPRPSKDDLASFRNSTGLPCFSEDIWRQSELYNSIHTVGGSVNRNIKEIDQLILLYLCTFCGGIGGTYAILPDAAEPWEEDANGTLPYSTKHRLIWKELHDKHFCNIVEYNAKNLTFRTSKKQELKLVFSAGEKAPVMSRVVNCLESTYSEILVPVNWATPSNGIWVFVTDEN